MTDTTDTLTRPPDAVADLVDRYLRLWNDPDPASRADAVRTIWAPRGRQVLQAPADMRSAADRFGFTSVILEVRGYAELEHRVARSYDEFVRDGAHRFAPRGPGIRLGDLVKLAWDMVVVATDEVVGGGAEVLVLDDDGRVLIDHQFIDP